MPIPVFQVDAFADRPFEGNPAAVCPLQAPLPDDLMQRIARENNLSETAFCVRRADGDWDLRWFTPTIEVELCGHATLASAHVLLGDAPSITFHTRSGPLRVVRRGALLQMDLPALPCGEAVDDPDVVAALGVPVVQLRRIREVHGARHMLAEVPDAGVVRGMAVPDLGNTNVIVTAAADSDDLDFVSRFFAPGSGVPEDPVTGSAHCTLTPLWASRLGQDSLRARQVSSRGGSLRCTLAGDRVLLAGSAVTVMEGTLWPEPPEMSVEDAVQAEIERLHRFFVSWFAGDLPDTDAAFEQGCTAFLDPGFVLVEPSGAALSRDALLSGLRAGHGGNPGFRIEVRDVVVVARHGALVVVSYTEAQQGAKRSPHPSNTRRSVATLQRTPTGWRWLHVQETWTS